MSIDEILNSSNHGRDLIVECYPQFKGVADDKMVKLRDESCASAHIHLYKDKYILKDFGDGGPGRDGVQVYADTHQLDIKDAVHELAVRYGLESDSGNMFGPKFETRPLTGEMHVGEKKFEYKSSFSKSELAFLGPDVTEEFVSQLSWHSVARIIICRENDELLINSTPSYPIFVRDMRDLKTGEVFGHKIYQPRFRPKADGKNYKFSYYPKGIEPGSYIHGLYELEHAVSGDEKVEKVAIVSGERDALVAMSNGVYPIWLNSETKDIPPALVSRLSKLAKEVYYIPDIDATGKREGEKNLKLYPTLRTVWLPDEMLAECGDQTKACKDLRDWAGLHTSKHDFTRLLHTAKRYRFWDYHDKSAPTINLDELLYFLNQNGYWRIKNDVTGEYEFVHIDGHIVRNVTPEDIRKFLIDWSRTEPQNIRNLLLKNRKAAIDQYNDLPVKDIDFCCATKKSQVFCFRNKQIMVTDEGIFDIDEDSLCYFKQKKVIQHDIKLLPPMFDVEESKSGGQKYFAIVPRTDECKLFMVFIRTSTIHWKLHEAGIELTPQQLMEEDKCLASKMFGTGHYMHRFRLKARDWAGILMDNNTNIDDDDAEGGTGKSILYTDVLPKMGYVVVIYPAKNRNPMNDDFIFDQMTCDTDIFVVDECPDGFEYDKFNAQIAGPITVNKKNKSRFDIPYKQAPKMAFITNFVPHDFGGSAMRRHMPLTYSDYFHHASPSNGFSDTRTIFDEFGMVLMDDEYPWEDYNRDFNFLLQCEQFYLKVVNDTNGKLTPDLTNVLKRHSSTLYDAKFDAWADSYFADEKHLNCEIQVDALALDYSQCNRIPISNREMKRQLKAWTSTQEGLEYNPLDKCNENGRRIRHKVNGKRVVYVYIAGSYEGE